MTEHELVASPATCHWGSFDATLAPVLTVAPGDRVTLQSVSGPPYVLPGGGFHVPPELYQIHQALRPDPGPHILTGPIRIEGARPGDVLEVQILKVQLRQDWGYTRIRPLWGTLPEDFPEPRLIHIALDAARMIGRLPSRGTELPLRPFFGVMGVAPPLAWGRISTTQPRAHGGNLDNKELVAGTTLYLPVWTEGAQFWAGDGHGVQGDGEVCVTAIETALKGVFSSTCGAIFPCASRPPRPPRSTSRWPPTPTSTMPPRMRSDMIALIRRHTNLDAAEAYVLAAWPPTSGSPSWSTSRRAATWSCRRRPSADANSAYAGADGDQAQTPDIRAWSCPGWRAAGASREGEDFVGRGSPLTRAGPRQRRRISSAEKCRLSRLVCAPGPTGGRRPRR